MDKTWKELDAIGKAAHRIALDKAKEKGTPIHYMNEGEDYITREYPDGRKCKVEFDEQGNEQEKDL